jgi:hypothetical protein
MRAIFSFSFLLPFIAQDEKGSARQEDGPKACPQKGRDYQRQSGGRREERFFFFFLFVRVDFSILL